MIKLTHQEDCCGCAACAEICAKNCITMQTDSEGFRYPSVNEQQCIQCGLCDRVCPVKNAPERENTVLQTLVGFHRQTEIRLASSSGGIFSLIAEDVLQRGGIVYGAAFNTDFEVHHIRISQISDLHLLQGSKYVQSRMDEVFRQIQKDLNNGTEVLFSGVECQIEALKRFLHKEYDNLCTVDVLCHGVPSPLLWKKYCSWQEKQHHDKIKSVSFRKKNHGWKQFEMEIGFQQGTTYCKPFTKDAYMQLFLQNICLRPSCHQCRFKALERLSDITLGDSWGIQNYMPEMDDNQGTSVILVHTEQGKALLERLSAKMCYQTAETDRILPMRADSRKSVKPHKKRAVFFKQLQQTENIDSLAKLVRPSIAKKFTGKAKNLYRKFKKFFKK